MIQLKKTSKKEFSNSLRKYSFSSIAKSPSYGGWHEEISRCTSSLDSYLIQYIFNESIWLSFLIQSNLETVNYMHVEPIPFETLESVSNGAVLKLWLQLNKSYCLHASGIIVDDQVILFMGPKGAGKSTTAAYFSTKDYPVWCDDYCIIEYKDNAFYALLGQQKLRVKDETIEGLSIKADQLKPLFLSVPEIECKTSPADRFKSYYSNPSHSTLKRKSFLKVKAIFILSKRKKRTKVSIRPMNKVEGLMAFMNEIMLREIVSKEYMAHYFEVTKNILNTVPIYQVQATDDLSQINSLSESILNQLINEM